LKRHTASELAGYIQGSQIALVSLLVSAGFEHVFWRPDIAGLIGWFLGIMVAGMALDDRLNRQEPG
jgi:hypothetical protein